MAEDVSNLTGEDSNKRPPKNIVLNEVRFNGKDGKFILVNLVDRKDGEKAVETDLGEAVQVIFLKIRRRIAGYKNDIEKFYVSTEHNTKDDKVYLFGAKDRGTAEELYDKYKPLLKTNRVIYSYLIREGQEKELVRVIVKGSALNPSRESKAETTTDFFTYLNEKPKGEHTYMYVTKLSAVKESNKLGGYFSIDFKRGAKLPEDKLEVVVEKIKELHEMAVEQDNFYNDSKNVVKDDLPAIEYPDAESEGIDTEDIPF